jgi:3-methyladenine DNA glycosylase/8-oxoguanine DNA glycosylase
MAKVIERVGPLKFKPRLLTTFQSITHAIIHQQLSGKAASSILTRFTGLFGNGTFPSPQAVASISHEVLRSAGLSRSKALFIHELAQRVCAGEVPPLEDCQALTDDQLVARLTALKGVGRWTVDMLLIFNLGRPDILPIHDLGVRRGFQIAYGKRKLPEPDQLARFGRRWSPYRSTAALYLWRAADFLQTSDW